MSTSAARIAANRKNAQKSTGPRTEEGKRRVSHNAQTHGLTAQTICLAEESDDALYQLRRHMLEDLKPESEIQCQLAEQMIAGRWRLMRLWEIETDLYDQALEEDPTEAPATRRRTRAFQKLAGDGSLDKLGRYEARITRDYDRALRRFNELKAQQEQERQRERKEAQEREQEYLRHPPLQHTDLMTTDEYIRLQRKEKAPEQNKPNLQPSAPSESSASQREPWDSEAPDCTRV